MGKNLMGIHGFKLYVGLMTGARTLPKQIQGWCIEGNKFQKRTSKSNGTTLEISKMYLTNMLYVVRRPRKPALF